MMSNDDIASKRRPEKINTQEVVRRGNDVVEALDRFYRALNHMDRETYGMTMVDLFAQTRAPFEAIEDAFKKSEKVREFQQAVRIPEYYFDNGITSLTIGDRRVTLSLKVMGSIRASHKDEAIKWLEEFTKKDDEGNDIHPFSAIPTKTVNASTLSAAVKVEIVSNNFDFPSDLFETYFKEGVSVTKLTGKK